MEHHMYPDTTKELTQKRKELAPEIHSAFRAFGRRVFADGALPEKTKQLIAVAVAHVTQCPYCIRGHTELATKKRDRAGAHGSDLGCRRDACRSNVRTLGHCHRRHASRASQGKCVKRYAITFTGSAGGLPARPLRSPPGHGGSRPWFSPVHRRYHSRTRHPSNAPKAQPSAPATTPGVLSSPYAHLLIHKLDQKVLQRSVEPATEGGHSRTTALPGSFAIVPCISSAVI